MAKLNSRHIAAIKNQYLEGQATDTIAAQFDVSGQYIRKLTQENGWAKLREDSLTIIPSTLPSALPGTNPGTHPSTLPSNLILSVAKHPENYGKRTEVTRAAILERLKKGVSITAAARLCGLQHKQLVHWRSTDTEFDLACHDAQADFVAKLEIMAGDVLTSKEALAV